MPPICAICHEKSNDLSTEGTVLISFALNDEQKEYNQKLKIKGITGHPKGLHWFCEKHKEKAKALSYLNDRIAINLIKIEENLIPEIEDAENLLIEEIKKNRTVTIRANKEYFQYIKFDGKDFYEVDGDPLIPNEENIHRIDPERALYLICQMLKEKAEDIYEIKLKTHQQLLQFNNLFKCWMH